MPTVSRLFTRRLRPVRHVPPPQMEAPTPPPEGYSPPPQMSPKQPSRVWQWIKRLLKLTALGFVLAIAVGGGAFFWFSRDLPSVEELRTWRPAQVTKVACRD